MLPLGFVWGLVAYSVGGWGYVLVRGWDINFREWISPLHPYQWPASGDPPTIPVGRIWPHSGAAQTGEPVAFGADNPGAVA